MKENRRNGRRLAGGVALSLGLLLLVIMFWLLGMLPAVADTAASVYYVGPSGNCGGASPCYAAVQDAVVAASDGDTIRVAQGTYTGTVVLTKSLILEGGWNADFTARDWSTYVTTLDAQRAGSVIRALGFVSPTIEGFVITGGDGSSPHGWGGGIEVYGDTLQGIGTVIIRHNVITDNIACRTGSTQGEGGAIRVGISTAIIEHNTIISNAASLECKGGQGGGLMVGWRGNVELTGNTILSNTAAYTPTSPAEGQGGGVYVYSSGGALRDNEIRGNVAAWGAVGRGGGVYAGGALYGNRILSNTASVNGVGYGGGVYGDYVTVLDDNLVQGNVASQNGDGTGGGVWAWYLARAEGNTIVGNVATRGGGIYYSTYGGRLSLRQNLIARNQATGTSDSPPDGGGGIASAADEVQMVHNDILSNTAQGAGGGVLFTDGGNEGVFLDNRVISNTAFVGGGVAVYTATVGITRNQIVSNVAVAGGGLMVVGTAQPTLDGNVVLSNTAHGIWGAGGGGVLVSVDSGLSVRLTNHIIAHNAAGAGGPGGGVLCLAGNCELINSTIVDNDRGDHKEGVYLVSTGGSHTLINNIIAGHSTGVWLLNGTATLDYNDYYENGTDVSGTTGGLHDRTVPPQFEDRAGMDYHLALTSPLIDEGDGSVAPDHDFEGDPRPRGDEVDIGADEAYPAEVYVSTIVGSDSNLGTKTAPFATVTKGLSEVRTSGTVYVARGNYTECVTVTRSVDLLGGYRETDWSRDIGAYVTTLDAERMGTVITVMAPEGRVLIEGFSITGGEAGFHGMGGGLRAHDTGWLTLRRNTIYGNHAASAGAGLMVDGVDAVIEANRIYDNVAEGVFAPLAQSGVQGVEQGPGAGGGLWIGGPARVVNNLVYSNTSGAGGDGVALFAFCGTIQFWHNTVVDNGGPGGDGVLIRGSDSELYNNLIAGHGTAISGTVQAIWDHNGFYDNDADYAVGLSAGAHDVNGDPRFADRAGHDYHLRAGSAMIDQGLDLGVSVDLDGAPRPAPAGTAPDLGAYEFSVARLYLPLVMKRQ